MANINRDYQLLFDTKTSSLTGDNLIVFATDRGTANIYITVTPIENKDLELKMRVRTANDEKMILDTVLVNEAENIYEVNLPVELIQLVGKHEIELQAINKEKIVTSDSVKLKVNKSITQI